MNQVLRAGADPTTLSDAEFRRIAEIARRDYGVSIQDSKRALIQSRLRRRLQTLGIQGFGSYLEMVEGGDGVELDHFIGALTTNVTRFFREPHHFRQLERDVLPALIGRARAHQQVRIWSAGCSTGQEPYSIAATVIKAFPDAGQHDLRILATDLDPFVLATAEAAEYRAETIEIDDDTPRSALFSGHDRTDAPLRIRPELRALVRFGRLNLNDDWPMRRKFDVIFCRNVVIYFDHPTQERLWTRFADALGPGGHLFIGHSERVHGPALAGFQSVGLNCYRKDR